MSTAAQEEFNILASKNTVRETIHPEDRNDPDLQDRQEDLNEEDTFRNQQIDSAMRVSTGAAGLKLPPASFDSGRSTGVKGVIADARSYETARQSKWRTRVQAARRSIFGTEQLTASVYLGGRSDSETDEDAISNKGSRKNSNNEEESFLSQWRDNRRKELESEASRPEIRQRRTSPSVRVYGRLDTVDALGYLDAVEKVGRATTVVVFVTDSEVSSSPALRFGIIPHSPSIMLTLSCFYSVTSPPL